MSVYTVKLKVHGRIRSSYPDTHVLLSLLYSRCKCSGNIDLSNVRVSSLFPLVEGRHHLPVPTHLLSKEEISKKIRQKIRKGELFVDVELYRNGLAEIEELESNSITYSFDEVPRVIVDRAFGSSNLYFDRTLIWWRNNEPLHLDSYYFVLYSPDDSVSENELQKCLLYGSLGGRKGYGAVITKVEVEEGFELPLSTEEGVLLSLAKPSGAPPKYYPTVIVKHLYFEKNGRLHVVERAFYFHGSYLYSKEYEGSDIGSKDPCKSIFVRPLFLEVNLHESG